VTFPHLLAINGAASAPTDQKPLLPRSNDPGAAKKQIWLRYVGIGTRDRRSIGIGYGRILNPYLFKDGLSAH
jgi:hypothetical protein